MQTNTTKHHLPILVGTDLLVEIIDLNTRLKCKLVGLQDDDFLIISLSAKDLSGIYSKDTISNSEIIVRYMHNGTIYGFKSTVLNMIFKPSRLAFLTYPDTVEEQNVRAKPRYECILPASVALGESSFDAILADISEGGCRAVIKAPDDGGDKEASGVSADVGCKAELRLKLPGIKDGLPVKGVVRSVNKDVDRTILGICFEGAEGEIREKLCDFISLIALIK